MKILVWSLIVLLVILRHDFWLWNMGMLVLGFMPVGLFYHACISVAAALTWLLATRVAWPVDDQQDLPKEAQP